MTDARRSSAHARVDRAQRAEWFASFRLSLPGVLAAAAIVGGIVVFTVPMGSARQIDGRIVAFAIREHDEGSFPYAKIDLAARSPIWVRLPRLSVCRIGQKVSVVERRVWLGSKYALGQTACLPVSTPGRAPADD